jgi:hypothetical protein
VKRIQLIKPLVFTERVSKAGNKYHAADCQGIAHGEDGSQEVFAFLMMAPYKERGTDLPAGDYVPVTQFKIDMRERKPVYEIVGFKPYTAASLKAA